MQVVHTHMIFNHIEIEIAQVPPVTVRNLILMFYFRIHTHQLDQMIQIGLACTAASTDIIVATIQVNFFLLTDRDIVKNRSYSMCISHLHLKLKLKCLLAHECFEHTIICLLGYSQHFFLITFNMVSGQLQSSLVQIY